ncbi:hypothetical protein [Thermovibrio sp.]
MVKTVNLVSRVESLNREFRTNILITEETYDRVKEVVDARPQAPIFVKGVKEPVKTCSVLSLKASA